MKQIKVMLTEEKKKFFIFVFEQIEDRMQMHIREHEHLLERFREWENEANRLLMVLVDKKKAFDRSWVNKAVYKQSYRSIVGNLLKFLIAFNATGKIYSEASNVQQDLYLYENFFHYISNGLPGLSISHQEVKDHLTSISFVTKVNNDAEEQLADMFGYVGGKYNKLIKGELTLDSLDSLDQILCKKMENKLFKGHAINPRKSTLYQAVNSFELIP